MCGRPPDFWKCSDFSHPRRYFDSAKSLQTLVNNSRILGTWSNLAAIAGGVMKCRSPAAGGEGLLRSCHEEWVQYIVPGTRARSEMVATSAQFSYDVNKDGQKFLINTQLKMALTPVSIVLNWTRELGK